LTIEDDTVGVGGGRGGRRPCPCHAQTVERMRAYYQWRLVANPTG